MEPNLSKHWPQPMRRVWEDYLRTDDPFRKVNRLVDCVEVHLKLLTVIAVQEALEHAGMRETLQEALAGKLATPAMGTWHHFLQRATSELKAAGGGRIPELVTYCKKGKTGVPGVETKRKVYMGTKSVPGALQALTNLRNHYAHGATPRLETCQEDVDAFHPLLEALLERATFLAEYRLVPGEPGTSRCGVRLPGGDELMLWPLMLHDEEVDEDSLDEDRFFFFNDRKRSKPLHYVEYVGATFLERDDRVIATYGQTSRVITRLQERGIKGKSDRTLFPCRNDAAVIALHQPARPNADDAVPGIGHPLLDALGGSQGRGYVHHPVVVSQDR